MKDYGFYEWLMTTDDKNIQAKHSQLLRLLDIQKYVEPSKALTITIEELSIYLSDKYNSTCFPSEGDDLQPIITKD